MAQLAKHKPQALPKPATLPAMGKSRYASFQAFSPFSREKFRQLSKAGKAPQPEMYGVRCTYYDNAELHRFLADPLGYQAPTEPSNALKSNQGGAL